MMIKWDTLCGRSNVTTETDTVEMFGGAICCWNCYSIYQFRQVWYEIYAS